MMKILLIGPQGSGKSTQAKLLSEYLKVPVVSTGEIFRGLSQKQVGLGEIVKRILEEGKLVDDHTTSSIVKERLEENDCRHGFIMDGYPRNLEQLRLFDPKFDIVFYLNVPEEMVLERLIKRGRMDDTEDSIKRRLTLYYQQTQPLLNYYKELDSLVDIEGEGSIEQVYNRIESYLEKDKWEK